MAVINIKNIPDGVKEKIDNIADHKGIATGALIKTTMLEIIKTAPPHMLLPVKKD